MTGARVLVAGVGNVFLGDDAFGVEVAHRLREFTLPERVDVADYGIRGVHLAYDLLDGRYHTLILVDALPLTEAAGTLAVVEVDGDDPGWALRPDEILDVPADGHGMDPQAVLRLVYGLGGRVPRILVVGCRPSVLDEGMGLSAPVAAALDEAVRTVARIAREEAAAIDERGGTTGGGDEWGGTGGGGVTAGDGATRRSEVGTGA